MQQPIKLNEGTASRRRVYFTAVDTAALQTRLTAADMGIGAAGSFVARGYKTGGATGAGNSIDLLAGGATITEVDSTQFKGLFYLELTAGQVDTSGPLEARIVSTGGAKVMEQREALVMVSPFDFYDAAAAGLTRLDATVSSRALSSDMATAIADLVTLLANLATVNSEVQDVQARIPAALVGGFIKAKMMAADTDTVNAAALAADAVTEIQAGLSTSAAVAALPTAAAIATAIATFVNDVNAPANAKTIQQILNILVSQVGSPGAVVAADQAIDLKNTAGTKSRVTGHITAGARFIDSIDGTP